MPYIRIRVVHAFPIQGSMLCCPCLHRRENRSTCVDNGLQWQGSEETTRGPPGIPSQMSSSLIHTHTTKLLGEERAKVASTEAQAKFHTMANKGSYLYTLLCLPSCLSSHNWTLIISEEAGSHYFSLSLRNQWTWGIPTVPQSTIPVVSSHTAENSQKHGTCLWGEKRMYVHLIYMYTIKSYYIVECRALRVLPAIL